MNAYVPTSGPRFENAELPPLGFPEEKLVERIEGRHRTFRSFRPVPGFIAAYFPYTDKLLVRIWKYDGPEAPDKAISHSLGTSILAADIVVDCPLQAQAAIFNFFQEHGEEK